VGYQYEWNAAKATANLRKHGVSFEEASTVFGDPLSINLPDPSHSIEDDRFLVLGLSIKHRLLVVAYAERGDKTRIISARPATRRERHDYEEG
jgi:uncharacterized DUF497 family protein